MMAAGEAGGILDTILQRLSTFIEKQAKLVSQVRSAMIYPIAVLSIAAIVVIVIMVKVVPTFTTLFDGLGATAAARDARRHLDQQEDDHRAAVLVAGGVVLGCTCSAGTTRRSRAGMRVDAHAAADAAARQDLHARSRSRGSAARCRRCISSGVPILDGLDITAKTSGNAIIETGDHARCAAASSAARRSRRRCARPASSRRWWSQMIGAGESTGALDTMLAKIADFYEDEVDVAVAGLLTILEPLLICVLGVIVGGIVISMYLPLFDLINQLSH